jgi:RNA polymerase primary sigma factor
MPFPSDSPEKHDPTDLLFESDEEETAGGGKQRIELFPESDKDFERLRLHFYDQISEDAAQETGETKPFDYSVPKAYELPPGEAIDSVGLYLKEMSNVPLLNMEQEVDLAKRIEAAKKTQRKIKRMKNKPTAKQEAEFRRLIEDGRMAREHLIKANTRLVVSIAKKYMGRGVPFLDLIQEGNLGLMKAVSKFDYRRGFRFSTYATWWIRQTITRSIADQGRTIRVPVHMIDRIRQLYKTAHLLEQRLGHPPTVEDLANTMDEDTEKIEWMLQVSWLPLSLESPVGDEEDSELGMFVEDENSPSPSQAAYDNMMVEKVHEVLATLSPREARILRLRFGLENGRTYTLEEVGEKFGLTRERIRQIEGKALRRLRHPMRARQLKDYV